jgi:hypothetical protein
MIDRCLPQDSVALSACYTFPSVSQLSFAFPILDPLLFRMWMIIACRNYLSVCLRNRDSSITLRVPSAEILACHSWEIRHVPEYMNCDVLVRLETGFLNELMGKTGRADNVGSSGDTAMSRVTFSVDYLR